MDTVESYFEVQKQYYDFLKEKLGDKFRGDSDKANGQVCISNQWVHLASLENRLKLREIALHYIAGNKVHAFCRRGNVCLIGMIDFPYFIEVPGCEYEFKWYLWDFNEVVDAWVPYNPSDYVLPYDPKDLGDDVERNGE